MAIHIIEVSPMIVMLMKICVVICRVHKPRVPHGPASQQRLGPAGNIVNDAQLLGQPKILNDRPEWRSKSPTRRPGRGGTTPASDSGPPLRLEEK